MERIYLESERLPIPLVTRSPGNRGKQERKKKDEHVNRKKEKQVNSLSENDTTVTNQAENEIDSDAGSKGLKVDIQV